MAGWIVGPLVGPTFGPLGEIVSNLIERRELDGQRAAGGYLAQTKGWRWIFWLIPIIVSSKRFNHIHLLICMTIGWSSFVATELFTREYYAYVILNRKTKRI